MDKGNFLDVETLTISLTRGQNGQSNQKWGVQNAFSRAREFQLIFFLFFFFLVSWDRSGEKNVRETRGRFYPFSRATAVSLWRLSQKPTKKVSTQLYPEECVNQYYSRLRFLTNFSKWSVPSEKLQEKASLSKQETASRTTKIAKLLRAHYLLLSSNGYFIELLRRSYE